ncbi:MFS transporter [Bacillus sp. E(2018)]|uniref:MFS transporter n=1 Tax=Bacillus sp. E(2018) TaxID=2502239 RepID=UPI001484D519|nr:MFS transporter [Bacillus sp. E(2018)]
MNLNYKKLLISQSVSMFGSQISYFTLPLIASISLSASASEVGFLRAAEYLPALLFGLFVGVYVDAHNKRNIMLLSDLVRAILLLLIPILWFFNVLDIYILSGIGFFLGLFSLNFDIAYMSLLPKILKREKLIKANSYFELSYSISSMSGPALAGFLVQLLTAPIAIIVDAFSFLFSAIFVKKIEYEEVNNKKILNYKNVISDLKEGIVFVYKEKLLYLFLITSGCTNLINTFLFPIYIVFLTQNLKLEAYIIGIIFSLGGIGAIIGAAICKRLTEYYGQGKIILITICVTMISSLFVPIINNNSLISLVILSAVQFIQGFAVTIRNINQVSIRMILTPNELQGRMNSSFRFVLYGVVPIGSILGGLSGDLIGIKISLLLGALLFLIPLWLFFTSKIYLMDEIVSSKYSQVRGKESINE